MIRGRSTANDNTWRCHFWRRIRQAALVARRNRQVEHTLGDIGDARQEIMTPAGLALDWRARSMGRRLSGCVFWRWRARITVVRAVAESRQQSGWTSYDVEGWQLGLL